MTFRFPMDSGNIKAMWTCLLLQNVAIFTLLTYVLLLLYNPMEGDRHILGRSHVGEVKTHNEAYGKNEWKELRSASGYLQHSGKSAPRNSKFVILITTNSQFIPFAENWLDSIRRAGVSSNVTLVAEDQQTFQHFQAHLPDNFTVISHDKFKFNFTKKFTYEVQYQELIRHRTVYIKTLQEDGYDVLLADVDAVWLRNPLLLIDNQYQDYDIWVAQGSRKGQGIPCPCFLYIKLTNLTKVMTKMWIKYLQKARITDQIALSAVFTHLHKLKVKRFNKEKFPTGLEFFNREWHKDHVHGVYVAHGNHLGRLEGKKEAFHDFNLWMTPRHRNI